MDREFAVRYGKMFVGYPPAIPELRQDIVAWMDDNPGRLRADAAMFLLVTFDLMMARPLLNAVGDAPDEELWRFAGQDLGDIVETDGQRVRDGLRADLAAVLATCRELTPPVSAHQVMRVIDQQWDQFVQIEARFWNDHD